MDVKQFFSTARKVFEIKFGKMREAYVLGRELWASLTDAQKTELLTALMTILTPEQMMKGTELYGTWKQIWEDEEAKR